MPSRSRVICGLALLLTSTQAFATSVGNIRGIVRDEQLAGLAGATVTLEDASGTFNRSLATDSGGNFALEGMSPGEYILEAKAKGHSADRKVVNIRSGDELFVELHCAIAAVVTRPASSYKSVVRPEPAVAPLSRSTSTGSTMNRVSTASLPLGEDRPIDQVIATQPGFVQDGFGTVIPRGHFVASVQYRIDGVPVPDSVGNLLAQSIPLRLVESMDLISGGMAAEYGNRLGAVVDIATRPPRPASDGLLQLRYGSYNTAEPSATYAGMLGRIGVSVGASFLYSERALDPPAVEPVLHDTGDRGNLFARFDLKAGERDRFELFGFYVFNVYQLPLDPTAIRAQPTQPNLGRMPDAFGNAAPPFIPHDTNATEREEEAFVALSWLHSFGSRGDLQVSPYYKLSLGALDGDPTHALGATADPGATASSVTRLGQHGGAIAHYTLVRGAHAVKAGIELDGLFGRLDFSEWHRDDTKGGIDATMTASGTDRLSAVRYGGYVQERWEHGRLTLTGGVRLDGYHVALPLGHTDDEAGVSPRLGASILLGRRVAARVAVGMTWQPPPLIDAANAARIHGDASDGIVFDLKPETGIYAELGTDLLAARWIRFGVTGWGRWAWNQLDDNVLGNTGLVGYYNYARGRGLGVDGTLQLVVGPWLSFFANAEWEIAQGQTIISSKYLFEADELGSTAWETLDESQEWTANVGATLRVGSVFATVLANYGSGLRTGDMNTQHVPEHFRLDLTLEKSFDEIPLRPRLAIDIINVFAAHYAYRLANGVFGSTSAPPRELFIRLAIPLSRAR
jgi:hypothetical protein